MQVVPKKFREPFPVNSGNIQHALWKHSMGIVSALSRNMYFPSLMHLLFPQLYRNIPASFFQQFSSAGIGHAIRDMLAILWSRTVLNKIADSYCMQALHAEPMNGSLYHLHTTADPRVGPLHLHIPETQLPRRQFFVSFLGSKNALKTVAWVSKVSMKERYEIYCVPSSTWSVGALLGRPYCSTWKSTSVKGCPARI